MKKIKFLTFLFVSTILTCNPVMAQITGKVAVVTSQHPLIINSLPNGSSGQFLTTNGTAVSWASVNPNVFSYDYFTPSTGNTITSTGKNQLIADPAGTLLALTVVFPPTPIDGQTFGISISQIITTLTLNGNGNTVDGSIVTSAVNSAGRWVFKISNTTWYKVSN